jgi:hypothetical protein
MTGNVEVMKKEYHIAFVAYVVLRKRVHHIVEPG